MARGARKKTNNNKKKKTKVKEPSPREPTCTSSCASQLFGETSSQEPSSWNFDLAAGPGCHIARPDASETCSSWVLEWEHIEPEDYLGDDADTEIPDLALEDGVLTLCNMESYPVVAYITVYDTPLRGRDHQRLQAGCTTNNEGLTESCTTLIVLCPPTTFVHLCHIDDNDPTVANDPHNCNLRLDSDVQEWRRHPHPEDTHPRTIGFPLDGLGPYRCTQGVGGELTHFFAGNLHAIDFACPIGTPLLAVGDGTVVQVQAANRLTGIAVSNLFQWNSILLKLDPADGEVEATVDPPCVDTAEEDSLVGVDDNDVQGDGPLFVEYVHIATAMVNPGDRVCRGQMIGTSGSVGFSPEPHLHFAAYRSDATTAATVRVYFDKDSNTNHHDSSREWVARSPAPDDTEGSERAKFLPRAGFCYNRYGQVHCTDS